MASRTPRPGRPARGTRSGRPFMVLLDLLGRRWTLRVLWELRADPLSFRALRARCEEISPSVLNTRLRELREAAIIELDPDAGYAVTPLGRELCRLLTPLDRFATRWSRHLEG